jgi:hypothetical protein
VLGLQKFLWDELPTWANNGSCIEDIWKNFKDIVLRVSKVYSAKKSETEFRSRIL